MAIKRLDPISPGRNGTEGQETNAPHLIGLLRPRPERPRGRAAGQRRTRAASLDHLIGASEQSVGHEVECLRF
jgi:hypothetical protein